MTTTTINNKRPGLITIKTGAGTLWFAGWLFTIGFVHLTGWKILLGLVAWPYYLGAATR